jgi:hypothetical protein
MDSDAFPSDGSLFCVDANGLILVGGWERMKEQNLSFISPSTK